MLCFFLSIFKYKSNNIILTVILMHYQYLLLNVTLFKYTHHPTYRHGLLDDLLPSCQVYQRLLSIARKKNNKKCFCEGRSIIFIDLNLNMEVKLYSEWVDVLKMLLELHLTVNYFQIYLFQFTTCDKIMTH